jgi:two-component sensor histidine kinase
MLPLILFAGVIVYSHYLQDQREAFGRVLQVTRGIRLVLDREMQGIVSGLTVLADSRSLAEGDLDRFRASAETFLRQFPDHPSIVIADTEGQQIFNSSVPAGEPLPKRTRRPERDEVFVTGKPAFSELFMGSVSKRPIVTVTVPIMRDNKTAFDLSFDIPLQIFQRIIDQQKPSDDWTISIFDQSGVNFARVPNPEQTFGKKASPTLLNVLFSEVEGQSRTISLEGVPLLSAFSRSELSGWIPAAGIAEKTLIAPALSTFLLAAAIGTVMLLIGLTFAIRMATQIARAETLHSLLIDELNHRVKNTLATVQSLAAQTFRGSTDADAKGKFAARLVALGKTHDLLSEEKWEGANIREVVDAVLSPFQGVAADRVKASGPAIRMSSRSVVMLAMVLHELATNAAKYGALSGPNGKIAIVWQQTGTLTEPRVTLHWKESGGPAVRAPERTGFGSTLIQHGMSNQLGGSSDLKFEPAGVECTLECPAL